MFKAAFVISNVMLVSTSFAQDYDADFFKTKKVDGSVTINTKSAIKGADCAQPFFKKCKAGEPCVSDVQIDGEAAKQLYTLLKTHGVKSNEVEGDYVATKSEALTCQETDGKYSCSIRYNVNSNSLEAISYCGGE